MIRANRTLERSDYGLFRLRGRKWRFVRDLSSDRGRWLGEGYQPSADIGAIYAIAFPFRGSRIFTEKRRAQISSEHVWMRFSVRAREMYHRECLPRYPLRRAKDSLASERYRMNSPGFISVPRARARFLPSPSPAFPVILRPEIDGDTYRLMPETSKNVGPHTVLKKLTPYRWRSTTRANGQK